MILAIGSFEPKNTVHSKLEMEIQTSTINWEYTRVGMATQAWLRVDFAHGEPRKWVTNTWAMLRMDIPYLRFHANFLLPEHCKLQHIKVVT